MIDLHNHLIPGIDDGAPDLETALELADIAEHDGITHMVCTPHIEPGRYPNSAETIAPAFDLLNQALRRTNRSLAISHAAEIHISPELLDPRYVGTLPSLGVWEEKPVILLELPHGHVPPGTDRLVKRLMDGGIAVMIAHPERNKGFISSNGKLAALIELGCLLQVTAGSVTGRFGPRPQELAIQLLDADAVTILASDAHNLRARQPRLREAFDVVEERYGHSVATRLLIDNPAAISEIHFHRGTLGYLSVASAMMLANRTHR